MSAKREVVELVLDGRQGGLMQRDAEWQGARFFMQTKGKDSGHAVKAWEVFLREWKANVSMRWPDTERFKSVSAQAVLDASVSDMMLPLIIRVMKDREDVLGESGRGGLERAAYSGSEHFVFGSLNCHARMITGWLTREGIIPLSGLDMARLAKGLCGRGWVEELGVLASYPGFDPLADAGNGYTVLDSCFQQPERWMGAEKSQMQAMCAQAMLGSSLEQGDVLACMEAAGAPGWEGAGRRLKVLVEEAQMLLEVVEAGGTMEAGPSTVSI